MLEGDAASRGLFGWKRTVAETAIGFAQGVGSLGDSCIIAPARWRSLESGRGPAGILAATTEAGVE